MKKTKIGYIDGTDIGGKPITVTQLVADVAYEGFRAAEMYAGLTARGAKGRRKVRITITVEAIK